MTQTLNCQTIEWDPQIHDNPQSAILGLHRNTPNGTFVEQRATPDDTNTCNVVQHGEPLRRITFPHTEQRIGCRLYVGGLFIAEYTSCGGTSNVIDLLAANEALPITSLWNYERKLVFSENPGEVELLYGIVSNDVRDGLVSARTSARYVSGTGWVSDYLGDM